MVSEPGFYPVYTPAHMEPSSAAMDIVQRTENMIFDRALNQRKALFFPSSTDRRDLPMVGRKF